MKKCNYCKGAGQVMPPNVTTLPSLGPIQCPGCEVKDCPQCEGKGWYWSRSHPFNESPWRINCGICKGDGKITILTHYYHHIRNWGMAQGGPGALPDCDERIVYWEAVEGNAVPSCPDCYKVWIEKQKEMAEPQCESCWTGSNLCKH